MMGAELENKAYKDYWVPAASGKLESCVAKGFSARELFQTRQDV